MSSFDLHPILDAGQAPRPGIWYAISPENESEAPCARVGTCASFLPGENGGKVVLTCGATPEGPFSDVRQLTLTKGSFHWTRAASTGLPPRYEHAMFAVGGKLYTFAGAQETGPMNDVWQYDPDSGCWREASPQGVPPAPRTLHCTTCARGTSLLVFSGGTTGTTPTDDQNVYRLETAPLEWSCPTTSGAAPSPRQGHVLAVVGSRLFVHGGMAGQEIFGDLHMLDLDTWSWSESVVSGAPPPPLAAHGCAVVERKLYVFGGLTIEGASDALYCLDTDTMHWEKVPVSGPPPPARLDHAMCSVLIPAGDDHICPTTGPRHSAGPGGVGAKPFSSAQGEEPPYSSSGYTLRSGVSDVHKEDSAAILMTVISPENLQTQDVSIHPSESTPISLEVDGTSTGLEKPGDTGKPASHVLERDSFIPALFVFGGMDTCGTIHGDCFVFVPHLSARS